MVVAAMMPVFVVAGFAVTRQGGVMIGMSGIVVAMIVGVHAQGCHIVARMPVQVRRRRPGELERDDEHENQDN